jgi:hypothetical protein
MQLFRSDHVIEGKSRNEYIQLTDGVTLSIRMHTTVMHGMLATVIGCYGIRMIMVRQRVRTKINWDSLNSHGYVLSKLGLLHKLFWPQIERVLGPSVAFRFNPNVPGFGWVIQRFSCWTDSLTSHFDPLPRHTNVQEFEVTDILLAHTGQVLLELKQLKTTRCPGPDFIPNKILKNFAFNH